MIQKTEWGHINWLHTQNDKDYRQSFSVGITCIQVGGRQPKHIHYGFDQFIYILEGEGIYIINGVETPIKKDRFYYLEADVSHQTINTGKVPIKEFIVSHPVNYDSTMHISDASLKTSIEKNLRIDNLIFSAVEAIRTQLLKSISLPFTIYDDTWSIVIQSNNFSSYCYKKCGELIKTISCDCMIQKDFAGETLEEGSSFVCTYGLTIFNYPIIYDGNHLGSIRGGHILISNSLSDNNEEIFDSPNSAVIGVNSLLKQIVSSILSYCVFNSSRQELAEKDKSLREVLHNKEKLEKSLYVINDKVTNLRINHHFLFNTLNSLASMSLTGDKYDLYNAIVDLSKMFRYTMTVDLKFVSLDSEIEYLETYLNLQRLRYGKELNVEYKIDKKLKDIQVPFNFLQPIVENAFTHGFSPSNNKKIIQISVEHINGDAQISVFNNGVPLDEITSNRLNKSIKSNTGHGLSLIYEKLKSAYNDNFTMEIVSGINETGVFVKIPIIYYNEEIMI